MNGISYRKFLFWNNFLTEYAKIEFPWHSHCFSLQMGQTEPINLSVTEICRSGGAACKAEDSLKVRLVEETDRQTSRQTDRRAE